MGSNTTIVIIRATWMWRVAKIKITTIGVNMARIAGAISKTGIEPMLCTDKGRV